ncbi:MAG: DUF72 domain-containing protein [Nitrososphaerales archaeon]
MQSYFESEKSAEPGGIRFGCLSWTYPDWLGSFYALGTKPSEYLSVYSRVFNLVEVDSSFYRTPSPSTVKQWREKTPANFRFTAKLPGKITHELRLAGIDQPLERFEKTMTELQDKLACVIAQLPPNSKKENDFSKLESFLEKTNPRIRYAIEFRNKSWLAEETFSLLSKKKVCFVWSVTERMDDFPPRLTTDFVYLRFMGKYGEFKKFDRIQKDRTELVEKWWNNLKGSVESVTQAFVLVSNHFSGFAPDTVNQIRKLADYEKLEWPAQKVA